MPKSKLRDEARRLRSEGKSIKEIESILSVARSSVSVWVRDIKLTDNQKRELHLRRGQFGEGNIGSKINRDRTIQMRLSYQQAGRERAKAMNPLHIAGCMLYWAEGAKGRNGIYFVNSDPNMVILFVKFLHEEMKVTDEEIAIRVHCHTHNLDEIRQIENYWANLLYLPLSNVKKTYVKQGTSSRKHILINGICDIRVHRTDLIQHIYGAIQEYGGFEKPEWLA